MAQQPDTTLVWCNSCFRRVGWKNSRYCSQHRPESDAESVTAYRRGQRIRASLPVSVIRVWAAYRDARLTLGEMPSLQSQMAWPLPSMLSTGRRGIVVETLSHDWSEVRQDWDDLLVGDFPELSTYLNIRPSHVNDHAEFAKRFLKEVSDHAETTTHPLWLVWIMACAEGWYPHECSNWDRRENQTSAQVKRLWEEGLHNAADISRRLGISKQRASKILKDLGLR